MTLALVQIAASTALQPGAIGTTIAPLTSGKVPMSYLPVRSGANTLAAGNDSRIVGALQAAGGDASATYAASGQTVGAIAAMAGLDHNTLAVVTPLCQGAVQAAGGDASGTLASTGQTVGQLASQANTDHTTLGSIATTANAAIAQSAIGQTIAQLVSGTVPAGQLPIGTSVAAYNDSRITGALPATAVGITVPNLTSGTVPIAQLPVGTTSGTLAFGDDSRIVGALPASAVGSTVPN